MCEHLLPLDNELKERRIKETFRGQPWSNNTREWVYFDCVLMVDEIKKRYNFPDFVSVHVNDDNKSGMEKGFYCELCMDGVMGHHPLLSQGKIQVS